MQREHLTSAQLRCVPRSLLADANTIGACSQDIPLDVVYEDAHLLVLNKPAGLVVHPSPGHESGTLVNAVLHHCNLPAVRVLPGQLPPASLDADWGAGVFSISACARNMYVLGC